MPPPCAATPSPLPANTTARCLSDLRLFLLPCRLRFTPCFSLDLLLDLLLRRRLRSGLLLLLLLRRRLLLDVIPLRDLDLLLRPRLCFRELPSLPLLLLLLLLVLLSDEMLLLLLDELSSLLLLLLAQAERLVGCSGPLGGAAGSAAAGWLPCKVLGPGPPVTATAPAANRGSASIDCCAAPRCAYHGCTHKNKMMGVVSPSS